MIHGVNNVNKMHCLQRGISISFLSFFLFFFRPQRKFPIKLLGYSIIKNILELLAGNASIKFENLFTTFSVCDGKVPNSSVEADPREAASSGR